MGDLGHERDAAAGLRLRSLNRFSDGAPAGAVVLARRTREPAALPLRPRRWRRRFSSTARTNLSAHRTDWLRPLVTLPPSGTSAGKGSGLLDHAPVAGDGG